MRSDICGFVLRPAVPNDREYLLGCLKETILMSVAQEEAKAHELWIDGILAVASKDLDGGGIANEAFILWSGGTAFGTLWMGISRDEYTCDATGYVLCIYVREDMRCKGIGRELLAAAEEWCRDKGLLSMTLNVGAPNSGARKLYESLGFCERSAVLRKDLTL